MSVIHAQLLAEVLHHVSEPTARALTLHQQTHTQLRLFYDVAVRRDQETQCRARQASIGPSAPNWQQRLGRSLVQHGLAPAIRGDLQVRRAFVRDFHMLEAPGAAFRRLSIRLRILRFWLRGTKRNAPLYAPPAGPGRADMRRLLGLSTS